jgi:hypothetical protein
VAHQRKIKDPISSSQAEILQYIDLLLNDLGVETRRKPNVLADNFLPYYPKHYRGLIEEFQRVQSRKQAGYAEPAVPGTARATQVQGMLLVLLAIVLYTAILWLFR